MRNGDELITTAEAAATLGISVQWANKLARRGRLPTVQKLPGGTGPWLFRRGDIDRIRRERESAA